MLVWLTNFFYSPIFRYSLSLATGHRPHHLLYFLSPIVAHSCRLIMAEPRAVDGENIFVYNVPLDVTHVIVDKSVKIIRREAFLGRDRLVSIEMHDGIEIIEGWAFYNCISLKGSMRLPGVRVFEGWAFSCKDLTAVEFGDKLETIGHSASITASL